jgi:hypothetical protein
MFTSVQNETNVVIQQRGVNEFRTPGAREPDPFFVCKAFPANDLRYFTSDDALKEVEFNRQFVDKGMRKLISWEACTSLGVWGK